ncbi:MAG: isochorismatase family cysteine hydrolase [Candidatus Hodarchaeota archaeon]
MVGRETDRRMLRGQNMDSCGSLYESRASGSSIPFIFLFHTNCQFHNAQKVHQSKIKNMKWENTALIVVDVQIGLFQRDTPIFKEQTILENINRLEDYAHSINIPVIYIQHANESTLVERSDEWQLHPRLKKEYKDLLIHKRHPNTFKETNFKQELEVRNIKQLVIVGALTDNCVSATCIGGKKLGYMVILVSDAHSTYSKPAPEIIEKKHNKLKNLGIYLKSTDEIIQYNKRT